MINFNSCKEIHSSMVGDVGTYTITLECDPNDTDDEIREQLQQQYHFKEECPGDTYVKSWQRKGSLVVVTFRCWGCD